MIPARYIPPGLPLVYAKERACKACGATFTSVAPNQLRCKPCAAKRSKETQANAAAKLKARRKATRP